MANRRARVVINRERVHRVRLALSDGIYAVAEAVLDAADPPDRTPYGEGLVRNGGALGFADGRKVNGRSLDGGADPRKPRGARVPPVGSMALAGYGFPGRFQEFGTVHQPARPFLSPAAARVLPSATRILASVVGPRLARIP